MHISIKLVNKKTFWHSHDSSIFIHESKEPFNIQKSDSPPKITIFENTGVRRWHSLKIFLPVHSKNSARDIFISKSRSNVSTAAAAGACNIFNLKFAWRDMIDALRKSNAIVIRAEIIPLSEDEEARQGQSPTVLRGVYKSKRSPYSAAAVQIDGKKYSVKKLKDMIPWII